MLVGAVPGQPEILVAGIGRGENLAGDLLAQSGGRSVQGDRNSHVLLLEHGVAGGPSKPDHVIPRVVTTRPICAVPNCFPFSFLESLAPDHQEALEVPVVRLGCENRM